MTRLAFRSIRQRAIAAERLAIYAPVLTILGLVVFSVSPLRPVGLLLAAAAAASGVLLVRTVRISCVVDDRGVVVRNLLRTHRAPWSDVSRIDLGTTVLAPRLWQARGQTLRFWIRSRPVVAQGCCDAPAETVARLAECARRHDVDVSALDCLPRTGPAWRHEHVLPMSAPTRIVASLRRMVTRKRGRRAHAATDNPHRAR